MDEGPGSFGLISDLNTDLQYHRSISCLHMLFKIYHDPAHPLHSELPSLFHPVCVTINAVTSHSYSFSIVRCNIVHHSSHFILASMKYWNNLPKGVRICEASEIQSKC